MRTFRTVLVTLIVSAAALTWLVLEMLATARRIEQADL